MLVILFRLLSFLPLWLLHLIGAAAGWLVYLLSPTYRRRLRHNITLAGHQRHLAAAIGATGKTMFELPFIWCADPQRVKRSVRVENWQLVQDALDAHKGIVFLTPHLGCFEVTAQYVAHYTELTVMYRPPRKAAFKPLLENARARPHLNLAPANLSGVRMLLKALKRGEPIGVLPDQVPQTGEGVWADFFGEPAYTITLPAKMHAMSGAPVILTYAERLSWGRGYVLRFVPFEELIGTDAAPSDTASQICDINRAMEQLIARCPSQYMWGYNRYKTPKGVQHPGKTDGDAA